MCAATMSRVQDAAGHHIKGFFVRKKHKHWKNGEEAGQLLGAFVVAVEPGHGVLCAELSFRRYQSVQNARKPAICATCRHTAARL